MIEFYIYPALALLFIGIFCREVIAPASRNSCDHRWLILSTCSAVATIATTLLIGYVFSQKIKQHAWISSAELLPDGVIGLLSFFLTSFVFYWWHRATHKFDVLWRLFHQLHHSAKRVEALTAFYAHPLDSAAAVLISGFSSYVVLGASPLAAGLALLLTGVFDLFLHSDLVTPRWLGVLVQRPEMHTAHHAYGHHAQNYGLPLWDMLFGTWVNPAQRAQNLGFDEEKSQRITDMLMFRDVHQQHVQQETPP